MQDNNSKSRRGQIEKNGQNGSLPKSGEKGFCTDSGRTQDGLAKTTDELETDLARSTHRSRGEMPARPSSKNHPAQNEVSAKTEAGATKGPRLEVVKPRTPEQLFEAQQYDQIKVPVFVKLACRQSRNIATDCEWQSTTWRFACLLKAHPKFATLDADQMAEAVPWHETDFDESEEIQVYVEWSKVKHVPGDTGLIWAWTMAKSHPLVPPSPFDKGRHGGYALFLSLAGWKQVQIDPEPIYVIEETWADLIKVSKAAIGNYRRTAVQQQLLRLVKVHVFGANVEDNRSGRYRFAIERYRILRDWK